MSISLTPGADPCITVIAAQEATWNSAHRNVSTAASTQAAIPSGKGQKYRVRHAQMPERSEIENNFTEGGKDRLGSEKDAEHSKFVS